MSTLPKGWEELSIGEVILPFKSIDPTKEPSKEFRYIDIGSIDNSRQVITDPKTFKGKDAPSRARRVVQDGDVLFFDRQNLSEVYCDNSKRTIWSHDFNRDRCFTSVYTGRL